MHKLKEPVPARRAHQRRRNVLMVSITAAVILVVVLSILLVGCGAGGQSPSNPQSAVSTVPSTSASATLTASDVDGIVRAAAAATSTTTAVIAVVDRAGNVLALYRKPDAAPAVTGNFSTQVRANDVAVGLARTAAFFSNDQAPLTSRTVRFISGVHFPPGVSDAQNADLYGIENTNRGCKLST